MRSYPLWWWWWVNRHVVKNTPMKLDLLSYATVVDKSSDSGKYLPFEIACSKWNITQFFNWHLRIWVYKILNYIEVTQHSGLSQLLSKLNSNLWLYSLVYSDLIQSKYDLNPFLSVGWTLNFTLIHINTLYFFGS